MRRLGLRLSAATLRAPDSTLSSQLSELAATIKQTVNVPQEGAALWGELRTLLKSAIGLKETDAALSVAHCLLKHSCTPPPVEDGASTWSLLFGAASLSDIEGRTPMAYASALVGHSAQPDPRDHGEDGAGRMTDAAVDRDILIMTGGIIPLTQRRTCATGEAFVGLLRRWIAVSNVGGGEDGAATAPSRAVMQDDDAFALMDALKANSATLSCNALQQIVPLVLSCTASTEVDAKLFHLLETIDGGHYPPPLPARSPPQATRVEERGVQGALAASRMHRDYTCITTFLDLERVYRILNVVRKGYAAPLEGTLREVERLCGCLDLAMQHNDSNDNPMQLDDDAIQLVRRTALEARVHCFRVEAPTTATDVSAFDEYLDSMCVDGVPRTFGMEYEAVQSNVAWLRWYRALVREEQDAAAGVSYATAEVRMGATVAALRAMVNLRPRGDALDVDTKALYQHAHSIVIEALCETFDEKWITEAYLIVVTHKYHQLSIDTMLIRPLLSALSRRGDCRVFNLVDLVTLYCGNKIDFQTMEALFQACRVAGDHHRAKALYHLLKDTVPGFLAKAPIGIVTALRDLRVVPPLPGSMFGDHGEESAPLVALPQPKVVKKK